MEQVEVKRYNKCPVCGGISLSVYEIKQISGLSGFWCHCSCGVVFENVRADKIPYSTKELTDLNESKEIGNRYFHYVKTYFPLIEELTLGRTMLNFADKSNYLGPYASVRGWYVKDSDADEQVLKYDLIWLCNVLHEKKDCVQFLELIISYLSDTGVIFISEPNTDFIFKLGASHWGNWSAEHSYLYWNPKSLGKKLESIGLDVLISRANNEERYVYKNDFHLLAQRRMI